MEKRKLYPIYRVRLELLYYNDQNDRIATWISQYKSEQGGFHNLSKEAYNAVIEDFIIKSNPASIEKTKNNIKAVNQREPGVIHVRRKNRGWKQTVYLSAKTC